MAPKKRRSEYSIAREIAQRLARAGAAPFANHRPQYIVLHGEREGEIIDFGRPLRAHRMFPTKTRSRADRIAKAFAAFATDKDQTDWRVWTIHRPSRKTQLNALVRDLKVFNALINRVFTRLRTKFDFELLLLGVHIEFDHMSHLFDIHAHFVCTMPKQYREEVRSALMTAFSRADLPDKPLRSAYGAANYSARAFKLVKVLRWPTDALLAARKLVDCRFRYVRTGGAFTAWRQEHRNVVDQQEKKRSREKRNNRKSTRYTGDYWLHRDQPLLKRTWKIAGEPVVGTLFRSAPVEVPSRTEKPRYRPSWLVPNSYSSAIGATTQTSLPVSVPPLKRSLVRKLARSKVLANAENSHLPAIDSALAGFRGSMGSQVHGCTGIRPGTVTPDRSAITAMNYVTKSEVQTAADQVDADGKEATARSVREKIKRGSFSTIKHHLKTWNPRDQRLELPPIPEGLTGDIGSLTGDIWHMALEYTERKFAELVAKATAAMDEAQAAAATSGEHADALSVEVKEVRTTAAKTEKALKDCQQQMDELKTYAYRLETENAQKDAQVKTLERALGEFAPSKAQKKTKTSQAA